MKKIIFFVMVILISGLAISATLKTYDAKKKQTDIEDMRKFLNARPGVYSYDTKTENFNISKKGKFNYQRISPIDGIYYSSDAKAPIRISKSGKKTMISITEGRFVFVLNDVFEKYEVVSPDFRIMQLGKGVFYIDSANNEKKLYSFNAILNLSLLTEKKKIAEFDLFPSMLFLYDPKLNKDIKEADVLRISTVDSIFYLDSKSERFKTYFSKENGDIIELALADIRNRIDEFSRLSQALMSMDVEDISGSELSEQYSNLFQNQTKKEVYLKNTLAKNFIDLLNNYGNGGELQQTRIDTIQNGLNQLENVSENAYQEGQNIIKGYYYISYFGNIGKTSDSKEGKVGIENAVKAIFKDKIAGDDHFSAFSDIFYGYQFTDSAKAELDNNIFNYVGYLKDKNIMKAEDYLPFSFFLTQYAIGSEEVSGSSIGIIRYLIQIFQNYYVLLKDADQDKEDQKKFSALSVQFYNFGRIIQKVDNNVLKKYFEKKNGVILLKDDYVNQSDDFVSIKIPQEIIDGLSDLYKEGFKDIQNKKTEYETLMNKSRKFTNGANNRYDQLEDRYNALSKINNMLGDYNAYYTSQKLNKDFRDTEVSMADNTYTYSFDDLKEYLSGFNGLDISSIKLLNESTMKKDGYYKTQVIVNSSRYSFNLNPDGHEISNVIIEDQVSNSKQNIPQKINLDEKKKLFGENFNSIDDPLKKNLYDFKNFLINLPNFDKFADSAKSDTDEEDTPKNSESRELSLFKQNNLIDGDFTNVKRFLDIPFSAIRLKKADGIYDISINGVKKSYSYKDSTFMTEISASYDYVLKQFKNITLKIQKEGEKDSYEVGGAEISIYPSSIGLKQLSSQLSDIGPYLNTIKINYAASGGSKIKLDLNSRKVSIDSMSFSVTQ